MVQILTIKWKKKKKRNSQCLSGFWGDFERVVELLSSAWGGWPNLESLVGPSLLSLSRNNVATLKRNGTKLPFIKSLLHWASIKYRLNNRSHFWSLGNFYSTNLIALLIQTLIDSLSAVTRLLDWKKLDSSSSERSSNSQVLVESQVPHSTIKTSIILNLWSSCPQRSFPRKIKLIKIKFGFLSI